MAVNFSQLVYLPLYNVFGRPITITPLGSQPGQPAYSARGIYNTVPVDVVGSDGTIFSDQRTIVDILEEEFAVLPLQLDRINIPAANGLPALGLFEVIDTDTNGGGETTLTVRKIVTPKPG
jgi:hypothetical protein